MKKVLLFVAVATVSLASCKKDRTCTCKWTDSGVAYEEVTIMHEVKKGDARQMCIGTQQTTTGTAGGASASTVDPDKTCELK